MVVSLNLNNLFQLRSALDLICKEFGWRMVIPKHTDWDTREEIPSIPIKTKDIELFPEEGSAIHTTLIEGGKYLGVSVDKYPDKPTRWEKGQGYRSIGIEFQRWGSDNYLSVKSNDGYCDDPSVISAGQHCLTHQFVPLAKIALLFQAPWHTEDGGGIGDFANFLADLHLHENVKHKYYDSKHIYKSGKGRESW